MRRMWRRCPSALWRPSRCASWSTFSSCTASPGSPLQASSSRCPSLLSFPSAPTSCPRCLPCVCPEVNFNYLACSSHFVAQVCVKIFLLCLQHGGCAFKMLGTCFLPTVLAKNCMHAGPLHAISCWAGSVFHMVQLIMKRTYVQQASAQLKADEEMSCRCFRPTRCVSWT